MNTVTRQDGVKEKRAEFTLARLHPFTGSGVEAAGAVAAPAVEAAATRPRTIPAARPVAPRPPVETDTPTWNASPLVPDPLDGDDDIPF